MADNGNIQANGSKPLRAILGLLLARAVIFGIVVFVLFFALLIVPYEAIFAIIRPNPQICPNGDCTVACLIPGFVFMLSVFVGIDFFTGRLTVRFRKLPRLFRSIGCFTTIFAATLVCGLISGAGALAERPFVLPQKNAASLEQNESKDGITVGVNLYLDEHLESDVLHAGNALSLFPSPLKVVELYILNGSENSIEIEPSDLAVKYNNQLIAPQEVVGYQSAQRHLKSFEYLLAPADTTTSEIVLSSPVIVGLAPRNYLSAQRWQEVLRQNAFEYGQIAPSQSRHGFVYFEIDFSGGGYDAFLRGGPFTYGPFLSLSGWEVEVIVHHSSDQTSEYSFAFGK